MSDETQCSKCDEHWTVLNCVDHCPRCVASKFFDPPGGEHMTDSEWDTAFDRFVEEVAREWGSSKVKEPYLCCDCGKKLEGEEQEHPVFCTIPTPLGQEKEICGRELCDECMHGLSKIPPEVFGVGPSKKKNGCYDGFACSEHFNEVWV